MKELKHKLGILYWKLVKQTESWMHDKKKALQRFWGWMRGWIRGSKMNRSSLENAHFVVICAHPDDETLYFSSVLKKEKTFVICMSGRGSQCRSAEFREALHRQKTEGILLNMPDVPHMDWVWRVFAPMRLRLIARCCKNVNTVYTHSCYGESSHPHHYATGQAAAKAFNKYKICRTAAVVPSKGEGKLCDEDRSQKLAILRECYPSQIKMLENWYPWWQDYLTTEYFEE